MAGIVLGNGAYTYEPVEGWGKLPDGWRYVEVAGVDVDSAAWRLRRFSRRHLRW